MKDKIYKNSLILERIVKLTKEERKEILDELLKTNTQRGLAKELGINKSTLHDWVSLRQNNTEKDIHISFNTFYRKISSLEAKDVTDWGRLIMIKEHIERLLVENGRF